MVDLCRPPQRLLFQGEAALVQRGLQGSAERGFHVGQRHPVLRSLGTRQAGLDRFQVQRQHFRVCRQRRLVGAEQLLFLVVAFDQFDFFRPAAGPLEVSQRFGVDGEKPHRGPVFRRHVGNRRSIRQRHAGDARSHEFDKLAHDSLLAEDLCDRQYQVGGGGPGWQTAGQLETDDFRHQHVERLAQHHRFGLDPPHPPADDAQAVDHRRVAVGADQGIGQGDLALITRSQKDPLGQVLEVHLMHNAHVGGHDAKILKGGLPPPQKFVTFAVAGELQIHVDRQRVGAGKAIDLHGMVDDQVHRDQRVDPVRVAAQTLHGAPHGSQIHHRWHPGKILQHDPRREEGDFDSCRLAAPAGQVLDVLGGDGKPVAATEDRFQEDADGIGELRQLAQPLVFEPREAAQPGGPLAGRELVPGLPGVVVGGGGMHRCASSKGFAGGD